jgi:DNA-binding HxlR family transcriptional regulator/peroxiredoxin
MRLTPDPDSTCSIAHALSVVGDQWSLLVVREVAGGVQHFEDLQRELGISRRTLSERLGWLVDGGVLERRLYQEHPPRFAYHLAAAGRGLLPVLIALQDWGSRFVLGDGSLTATGAPTSVESRRVAALVGRRVPELVLPDAESVPTDPCSGTAWTVLYGFPGAFPPGALGYPPGWNEIPGAVGCTIEATTYRDRMADFQAAGASVHGVSTQRPDQLAAFAAHVGLSFPLLSDQSGELAAALRLPTFRAGGLDRLKRVTLVIDDARVIRGALYPITDPAASIGETLTLVRQLTAGSEPAYAARAEGPPIQ